MSMSGPRGDDVVLAVDGPSGSGKSTTARGVARRLGLRYLDTGAMYRATTWALLRRGVDVDDPEAVAAAARDVRLDVGTDPDRPTIAADGVDVAGPIRGPEVTASVSAVSAVPAVRTLLVARQRELIGAGGIVVEGRDIGAVVAPDAELKVFLTAESAERAARRHAETGGAPEQVATTEADLARRDTLDSTRTTSPLAKAEDAVVVDTTHLGLEDVIDRIAALLAERRTEAGRTGAGTGAAGRGAAGRDGAGGTGTARS
jgi:CMP/dCMP kinase